MLSRIFAFTLLVSIPAFADDCQDIPVSPEVVGQLEGVSKRLNMECPNQVNVSELCTAVGDQLAETLNPANKYVYQTKIYKAACVEPTDTPEVMRMKVQNFWNKYHSGLNCSQLGFSVRNGHILKLAVEKNSRDFINDAIRKWKISLNHVDPADQKTVLDYISSELDRAKGTSMEPVIQRYFTLFRSNGAKYQREL